VISIIIAKLTITTNLRIVRKPTRRQRPPTKKRWARRR